VSAAGLSQQLGDLRGAVDERTLEILERRRNHRTIRRRGWLVRRMLLLADVTGLVAAFLIAELFFGPSPGAGTRVDFAGELLLFALTLPVWAVVAKVYGLYDHDEERTDHSSVDDFSGVFHLVTVGAWLVFAGSRLVDVGDPGLAKIGAFWGIAVAAISLARVAARALCRRHVSYLQNTVIVGTGRVGQLLARKLLQHPEYGINLVGFVDDRPKPLRTELRHLAVLGDRGSLLDIVQALDVERVILAFTRDTAGGQIDLVRSLAEHDVQIDLVPRFYELVTPSIDMHAVEGLPVMGLRPMRLARSSQLLKRGLDVGVAVLGLLFLAPLVAAFGLLIKLDSPGPVFYRQVRVGRADRRFRIWKLRTMLIDADERKADVAHLNKHLVEGGDPRMFKIENDPRVTPVGRFLRRYSLDELPQLLNVLRGEMSLVGPRPLIPEEAQHVIDWGRRRLELRPGVTGLWQMLGRDEIPFEEMVKLDYVYVTNWSLGGDLRLLFQTLPVLAGARGTGDS
jgi:exopolysaccharide biosynthesis polyprenyl glycosylphosphotransferase